MAEHCLYKMHFYFVLVKLFTYIFRGATPKTRYKYPITPVTDYQKKSDYCEGYTLIK